MHGRLELWEGSPRRESLHPEDQLLLKERHDTELSPLCQFPFLERTRIERHQKERIQMVLAAAYETPLYESTFKEAGVSPSSFRHLEDLRDFPIVTKYELIRAHPHGCVRDTFPRTYQTFSSGTSGVTMPIDVDPSALVTDTLHGIRQLILQSDSRVTPDDLTMHYYTEPWWANHVDTSWRSGFISSFVPPAQAAEFLREHQPAVLAGYPSLIRSLVAHVRPDELPLKLIITNSEQSARAERDMFARHFGCTVLDEYSSEEATRIALEMPDGRYYVHEDSVYLEILDPQTREPVTDGEWGEAVMTGLLNEAMPLIRYASGDMVQKPARHEEGWRSIQWSSLSGIGGRILDSFRSPSGKILPSGALLDVIYRSFMECDMLVERFELVQVASNTILFKAASKDASDIAPLVEQISAYLQILFEAPVVVRFEKYISLPHDAKKRRPIRCEIR